jgi:5S rRNA maturation endonuclease (ribonuclease M5)
MENTSAIEAARKLAAHYGMAVSHDWGSSERRMVATYDYADEHGEMLYQVVRYEPKTFGQRQPDGVGGWIWKKHSRQVLYRLREVLGNSIVFVVEGERDAETLRSFGFVATTNSGGARAEWLPEYTAALAGRDVILIPDDDPPGRERVARIARALIGHAARVRYLDLEGAKDITDWFERGHSEVELASLLDCQRVIR